MLTIFHFLFSVLRKILLTIKFGYTINCKQVKMKLIKMIVVHTINHKKIRYKCHSNKRKMKTISTKFDLKMTNKTDKLIFRLRVSGKKKENK